MEEDIKYGILAFSIVFIVAAMVSSLFRIFVLGTETKFSNFIFEIVGGLLGAVTLGVMLGFKDKIFNE